MWNEQREQEESAKNKLNVNSLDIKHDFKVMIRYVSSLASQPASVLLLGSSTSTALSSEQTNQVVGDGSEGGGGSLSNVKQEARFTFMLLSTRCNENKTSLRDDYQS